MQKRFGVHEVRSRETFRVGAVDCRKRGVCFGGAALGMPEPAEAHGSPQLPRLALLAPSRLDGLVEAALGGGLVARLGEYPFALEAR